MDSYCIAIARESKKHTTAGIRWSSPTQLLIRPSLACLWESGRDPEFSSGYGRMYGDVVIFQKMTISGAQELAVRGASWKQKSTNQLGKPTRRPELDVYLPI